jgi:hypothetical protein
MIKISRKPSFKKTRKYFQKLHKLDPKRTLHKYGKAGVAALSKATPKDTGEAGSRWSYKIVGDKKRYRLIWTNDDMAGDVPLVIIIQYGHATKDGGFVTGRDFINPALKPVYDDLQEALRREVNP